MRYERLRTDHGCGSSGNRRGTRAASALARQRVTRLAPGADAAVHGDHPPVAQLLQALGGQRRPETAPAVKDDVRIGIGDLRLDVAFEHAAAEVSCARRVA